MERILEKLLFESRWLLAPFYLGLVVSLALLLIKFLEELIQVVPRVLHLSESDTILAILSFVDLSLAGNLIVLVVFSGYESFVSRMDAHTDRPEWMGKVNFSGLKLKVMGSVVAISAIHLLRAFMNIKAHSEQELTWLVVIHLSFVVSGVLLALMDRLTASAHQIEVEAEPLPAGPPSAIDARASRG